MEITSVEVHLFTKGKLRGFATIVIDNSVAVHDIKVLDGDKGLYISMPSRLTPAGEHKDIVHPISREVRAEFEKAILEEYEKECQNQPQKSDDEEE